MTLGYIGLGKMGMNMTLRLLEKGHNVVVFDKDEQAVARVVDVGAKGAKSLHEVVEQLQGPRIIWLMVPHEVVDEVLEELTPFLSAGDMIIDGGNSFYKDSMRRAQDMRAKGIAFIDAGISGGPKGARDGACVMVGGEKEDTAKVEELFRDIAASDAYAHVGPAGAGHFVKMAHNGIEYGMMQALAEGFAILKNAPFPLDLRQIADLYNHRSVIESRLVGWLHDGLRDVGQEMEKISGSVGHTGEGEWTARTAKELGVPAPIIEGAFEFRKQSAQNPSYIGKVLSLLRNQFGGHAKHG